MKKTLLALALFSGVTLAYAGAAPSQKIVYPVVQHANYGTIKMVVPMSVDNPKAFAFRMKNVNNSFKGIKQYGGKLEVKFVFYGPGIKLFLNPSPELQAQIDTLRGKGVQFEFCDNTLHNLKIDYRNLYMVGTKDIVPSGFLEATYLETKGWVLAQ